MKSPGIRRRIRARRSADRALVDVDDLVDVLEARDARVRSWDDARAIEMPRQRAMQNVLDERDLPDPDTPVTATNSPSGISTSRLRRLCSRAPSMRIDFRASGGRRVFGVGIASSPLKYLPVMDAAFRIDLVHRADGDDLAAVLPCPGAEIDDVIRGAHRLFVVLDDDHRVAEIAQAARASRAAARCRAGAGRSTARRGCTTRRRDANRFASRAGCAALRRRKAIPPHARA